jgi:CxxC-x17-CxxC domain-containing protein
MGLVRKQLSNSLITARFDKFQKDMSYDREREMFDAKCGDCGNDCQIPFKPKEDRPVYCTEPRGGSRFGGRSSYGRGDRGDRGSRFGRRDDRPREMFDAKCGDCGNDCQIPFKPKEDRPVYCRECFQNHRQ